jgi:hypothetical protein
VAPATHIPAGALHLAVALDGAGWHLAAWREPDAQPDQLFTAAYWVNLAQQAGRGLLGPSVDRVVPLLRERGVFRADYTGSTLRDHLGLAPPGRPDEAARPDERAARAAS